LCCTNNHELFLLDELYIPIVIMNCSLITLFFVMLILFSSPRIQPLFHFFEMGENPHCVNIRTQLVNLFQSSRNMMSYKSWIETCINHRKMKRNNKLSILKSTNVSTPSSLEIKVMCILVPYGIPKLLEFHLCRVYL
jgi:hypothetical protein